MATNDSPASVNGEYDPTTDKLGRQSQMTQAGNMVIGQTFQTEMR